MVGHTHEDVDAGFSQIAAQLRTTDCETLDDLMKLLPNSRTLNHMFNVREWLEPHLVDVSKHTQPLHYKFVRSGERVKILYKGKQDQPWKQLGSSLFKIDSAGRHSLPKGQPTIVEESYDHINTNKLKLLINNLRSYFHKRDTFSWWNTFIEKLSKRNRERPPAWYLDKLPKQRAVTVNDELPSSVPEQILGLMNKEREEPQVKDTYIS